MSFPEYPAISLCSSPVPAAANFTTTSLAVVLVSLFGVCEAAVNLNWNLSLVAAGIFTIFDKSLPPNLAKVPLSQVVNSVTAAEANVVLVKSGFM